MKVFLKVLNINLYINQKKNKYFKKKLHINLL
jgi:hypothetical protein